MYHMDPTTLAAGLDTALDGFATAYGPLILLVMGFAIGLYGVKFIWGLVTTYIRVHRKA